ncbi:thiamine-phosphate kinase [Legionella gresilensis]|uniref:thiamine-phosphate kinase n=1 Tax=Legionella gresilensis TaxID=91823 RepID=UPI001041A366|nr:AIR synthase related protein [Legionella gresilensis]
MISEVNFIELMRKNQLFSPRQVNTCWQADCELLRLDENKILAVTTDGLSEELETKLYEDPFHIGWMLVTINASDLAAVAATPLGILCNMTLVKTGKQAEIRYLEQLQAGIAKACTHYNLPLLGGDTNFANHYQLSATALGLCEKPLTRVGAKPGDFICVSSYVGLGNLFAFNRLFLNKPAQFFPIAPLEFMHYVAPFATSCIDISDGVMDALEMLAKINNVGIQLNNSKTYLHHQVIQAANQHGFPAEVFLAGHHGDFEILFTIPVESLEKFLAICKLNDFCPLIIGNISLKQGVTLANKNFPPNTFRSIWEQYSHDIEYYLKILLELFKP